MPRRSSLILLVGGILLLALVILAGARLQPPALAAPAAQATSQPTPTLTPLEQEAANKSISNEVCLSCHGNPNLTMKLENGQLLGLYIPSDVFSESIHGSEGYACVQCHTKVGNYPHPPFSAADQRDASLKLYPVCQRCHSQQYERAQDSVHAAALQNGMRQAAICTDCHTAHAVRQLVNPQTGNLLQDARKWVPQTCARCHYAIYQKYSTSVHGAALLDENNPDVPTCIDCHGVHNIENPTTAQFRLKSPEICAKCHTDPKIMDKYGIPTQVLSTYVADFHGTTVEIFEKQSPDAPTNKAVCYDCHGVHDIQRVDDPQKGIEIKDNLLKRCQVCHPQATINFPTAWLSHYIPSPTNNQIVFIVDQFYKFFIPTLLGGMAILVVLDAQKLYRLRLHPKVVAFLHKVIPQPKLPAPAAEDPEASQTKPAESDSEPAKPSDAPGPQDRAKQGPDVESSPAEGPPVESSQSESSPEEGTPAEGPPAKGAPAESSPTDDHPAAQDGPTDDEPEGA